MDNITLIASLSFVLGGAFVWLVAITCTLIFMLRVIFNSNGGNNNE